MADTIDEGRIAREISCLGRAELVHELLNFHGAVRFDFTREYLEQQSVDQLRHVLLAARLYIAPRRAC